MKKEYVYIVCKTPQQFLEYQQKNAGKECVMLTDGTTLRGRTPGQILRIGDYQDRWNYQDIEESIDRETARWPDTNFEKDTEGIDYGI